MWVTVQETLSNIDLAMEDTLIQSNFSPESVRLGPRFLYKLRVLLTYL